MLVPGGRDAAVILELFWWMVGGAVIVWFIVIGLAYTAIRKREHTANRKRTHVLIIGGGAVFPTVVLTVLLAYGLALMPGLLDHGEDAPPRIHVTGERWWWRVRYELENGATFELANELRIPLGRRSPLWLRAADVIHAFWIPAIAGKTDMIPGRVNRAALEPTRTGTFRGVCAEYCGLSHAKMLLDVVVLEPEAYEAWLLEQQQPAHPPTTAIASEGAALFDSLGCGACHTIRGTAANGSVGPDLTHVGSRVKLGAGILENDVEGALKWLTKLHSLKPGVNMPSFGMLPEPERRALAAYLESLK